MTFNGEFLERRFGRRFGRRSNLQDVYQVGRRLAEPAPGVSWRGCSRHNKRLLRPDWQPPAAPRQQQLSYVLMCGRAPPRDHAERLKLCDQANIAQDEAGWYAMAACFGEDGQQQLMRRVTEAAKKRRHFVHMLSMCLELVYEPHGEKQGTCAVCELLVCGGCVETGEGWWLLWRRFLFVCWPEHNGGRKSECYELPAVLVPRREDLLRMTAQEPPQSTGAAEVARMLRQMCPDVTTFVFPPVKAERYCGVLLRKADGSGLGSGLSTTSEDADAGLQRMYASFVLAWGGGRVCITTKHTEDDAKRLRSVLKAVRFLLQATFGQSGVSRLTKALSEASVLMEVLALQEGYKHAELTPWEKKRLEAAQSRLPATTDVGRDRRWLNRRSQARATARAEGTKSRPAVKKAAAATKNKEEAATKKKEEAAKKKKEEAAARKEEAAARKEEAAARKEEAAKKKKTEVAAKKEAKKAAKKPRAAAAQKTLETTWEEPGTHFKEEDDLVYMSPC